jgi:thioredoxin-related protein
MMERLYKAILPVCALFFSILPVIQAGVGVPVGSDLQADARIADSRRLPILLVFTAIDCAYCELLEEEFLEPMLLGGEYEDRVIIRKIVLDNGSRLTDFSGQRRDATALSDAYRVFVTPTLLFVDGDGMELAARMLGINTVELFGGYLDDCIETALLNVRGVDASQWPVSCRGNGQRQGEQ